MLKKNQPIKKMQKNTNQLLYLIANIIIIIINVITIKQLMINLKKI